MRIAPILLGLSLLSAVNAQAQPLLWPPGPKMAGPDHVTAAFSFRMVGSLAPVNQPDAEFAGTATNTDRCTYSVSVDNIAPRTYVLTLTPMNNCANPEFPSSADFDMTPLVNARR